MYYTKYIDTQVYIFLQIIASKATNAFINAMARTPLSQCCTRYHTSVLLCSCEQTANGQLTVTKAPSSQNATAVQQAARQKFASTLFFSQTHQPKFGELDGDKLVQILPAADAELRAQGVRQPLLLVLELSVLTLAPQEMLHGQLCK